MTTAWSVIIGNTFFYIGSKARIKYIIFFVVDDISVVHEHWFLASNCHKTKGGADSDVVRLFAISKLPWIKKQVKSLAEQQREQAREYIEGKSIYYQGQPYLVKL